MNKDTLGETLTVRYLAGVPVDELARRAGATEPFVMRRILDFMVRRLAHHAIRTP
ncbi:hypothetical protein ACFV9E_09055 [Streptomyces sp. NPDC059835]|uniref:hypothetical protein n=1 Tax=Streptomyces sp. NPDC059835 TaxID=3346967 RepID=UPI0036527C7C